MINERLKNKIDTVLQSLINLKNIKNEIRKCEILCANCHAIHSIENKHHLKFNHTIHEEI